MWESSKKSMQWCYNNNHDYDEETPIHNKDDYDSDDEILDKNEGYNNDESLNKVLSG